MTAQDLSDHFRRIDGAGYKAYKNIRGEYDFGDFTLFIDHVQGDPFAAPSRVRVIVPAEIARIPPELIENRNRSIGLASYIAGEFARSAGQVRERRGSGKSGLIEMDRPGQQVLERTALMLDGGEVEGRFVVGLPAAGRRVLGRQADQLFGSDLVEIVRRSLLFSSLDKGEAEKAAFTNEDGDTLRATLEDRGLVAFIADGSVLPRCSGVDDRPLTENVIPLRSPESLRISIDLPHAGRVTGLGIPVGVTLIVGGGFHGKSTLLNALENGVYNHRPGDGRERIATVDSAVKVRAEDGRSVAGVDISPFISALPADRDTESFTSENASGSTSQAANILEALEIGARVLLIDEDTAATNFMIRDCRMQQLIAKEKEPITPFIDKVGPLYEELGVSTILVAGGSGDYFDVAHTVIAMDEYEPQEVTDRAKRIAENHPTDRSAEGGAGFGSIPCRIPIAESIDPSRGRREESIKIRDRGTIQFGRETIDISAVSQIVDSSQTRAIGAAILLAREEFMDGHSTLSEILDRLYVLIAERGLSVLSRRPVGDHAMFRRYEMAAAINRLRSLRVRR